MKLSTQGLHLSPDAFIDLQTHTTYSDGDWLPEDLLDHLVKAQFGLVAITDHDRPDVAATLQELAQQKQIPVLVAVEMTTEWNGEMMDVLCYGFDPAQQALTKIASDLVRRQTENTREVYENLIRKGYLTPDQDAELATLLAKPSPVQPHALVDLVKKHGYKKDAPSAGQIVLDAGCIFATNEVGSVVDAAHQSGAVCLIAHPGRGDGFVDFDEALLDTFRQQVPIDGLEVYYPKHAPEQTAMFREYAKKNRLLMSAGSDSHRPSKPPIQYRADLIPELLERVGIRVG